LWPSKGGLTTINGTVSSGTKAGDNRGVVGAGQLLAGLRQRQRQATSRSRGRRGLEPGATPTSSSPVGTAPADVYTVGARRSRAPAARWSPRTPRARGERGCAHPARSCPWAETSRRIWAGTRPGPRRPPLPGSLGLATRQPGAPRKMRPQPAAARMENQSYAPRNRRLPTRVSCKSQQRIAVLGPAVTDPVYVRGSGHTRKRIPSSMPIVERTGDSLAGGRGRRPVPSRLFTVGAVPRFLASYRELPTRPGGLVFSGAERVDREK